MFTVLPFGLSAACFLFTKVVRPLVRYWQAQGIRIVVYRDDGLGAAAGLEAACLASQLEHSTIERPRFVLHPSMLVWKPTQCLIWLGFIVDLLQGQVQVPEPKLVVLIVMLKQTRCSTRITARFLASMFGKNNLHEYCFGSSESIHDL